jgi:sec-independent protein translocase protein TatA
MVILAPGILGLGAPELLIILAVLILIFGATRLTDLGGSLGKGIREFRRNVKDEAEPEPARSPNCPNCGRENEQDAQFCSECGADLRAAVK